MARLVAERNRASVAHANTSAGNDCTSIELPKKFLKKRSLQNFNVFKSVPEFTKKLSFKGLVSMGNNIKNSTFLKKIISSIG